MAIQAVKQQYPNFIFMAEVYNPYEEKLQALGFDYTYDKNIYDKLGKNNLDDLRNWISGHSVDFITRSAHFITNHDEKRAVDFFGSWQRADAAALLTYTLPGVRFFWQAQQNGFTSQLDVHLRRERNEIANPHVQDFYDQFLPIISHDVFKKGTWTYLNVFGSSEAWKLVAYRWAGSENRLCVINFSDGTGSGRVLVSNAQAKGSNDTIPVTDLLAGITYYRSAKEMREQGLFVLIKPWFAQIFSY